MRVVRQLFKYSLGLTAPATIHHADCVFVFISIACNISCYISLSYSDSLCIFCSISLSFSCSISSSSFSFSLNSRCIFFSIFVSFSIFNSLYLYPFLLLPMLIFLLLRFPLPAACCISSFIFCSSNFFSQSELCLGLCPRVICTKWQLPGTFPVLNA